MDVRAVQASHFLEADTAPHAARFWRVAGATSSNNCNAATFAPAIALLADIDVDMCIAVFAQHPAVLDATLQLSAKFARLPPPPEPTATAAAAAAVAACLQSGAGGPTLAVNAGEADACARLASVLPLVPTLAGVSLYVPADGGDMVQGRRNSRATAERFLTRLATLPNIELTSLHAATASITAGDRTGGALGRLLRGAGTQLHRLALWQAPISWSVAKRHLIPRLPALRHRLRALELRECSLGPAGAKELAAPLATLDALTLLCLSGNAFKRKGAAALTPLSALVGLVHLDLSANKLGQEGVPPLATILTPLTRLEHLLLGWNTVRAEGSFMLPPIIAQMRGLATLSLAWNGLGISGARRLCGQITCLSALRSLDLSDNDLYDRGLLSLGNALRYFPALTYLALVGNFITEAAALTFGLRLVAVTDLRHLDLRANSLCDTGMSALVTNILILTSLTMLDVSDNEVGPAQARLELDRLTALPALQVRGLCQRPRRRDARGVAGSAAALGAQLACALGAAE